MRRDLPGLKQRVAETQGKTCHRMISDLIPPFRFEWSVGIQGGQLLVLTVACHWKYIVFLFHPCEVNFN